MRYIFTLKNGLAVLFLAIGSFLLRETYQERTVFFFSPDELGPMTYPRYLLWVWVVLSALYLIIPREPSDLKEIKASVPLLSGAVLAIGGYVALFSFCGLLISTFLFLLFFLFLLGYRRPVRLVIIAALTGLGAWLVFEKILAIPMPTMPNFFSSLLNVFTG